LFNSMRDPVGDRERRRRENRRRFIFIAAGLVLATVVMWTLAGSLAFLAAKLRVFG
jgi:hypothetical protein